MSIDTKRGLAITPHAVIGLGAILVGLLLTADNLNWLEAGRVLRFWPLAIVVLGASLLTQSRDRTNHTTGWVLLVAGAWLTAAVAFGMRVNIWDWWPLALVAAGIGMLRRSRETETTPGGLSPDQTFTGFAFWSGVERRVSSPAFRHANLTAVMGGVELDLRQAGTAGGQAVIDVFVMWGGIEITVPPDWEVDNQVVAIMGASEDKSSGMQGAKHRLVLRGFVLMGGVEIKT